MLIHFSVGLVFGKLAVVSYLCIHYIKAMKLKSDVIVFMCLCVLLSGCGVKKSASVAKQTYDKRPLPEHVSVSGNMAKPTQALLNEVDGWLGVPYKYAGEDKRGVDCSGLTMNVFNRALGIKLPRNSAKQQQYCSAVSKSDLAPGDLVFFANSSGKVNHVGMYIGSGNMVHASTSRGVIISSLSENYYVRNFHSAGRVEQYFAMLKKATSPAETTPMRLDPVNPPEQLHAVKQVEKNVVKAPAAVTSVPASALKSVRFSASTPPPATATAMDEARRKVLDEVVEQKADSILSSFFE